MQSCQLLLACIIIITATACNAYKVEHHVTSHPTDDVITKLWAVQLRAVAGLSEVEMGERARQLASDLHMENLGQIGRLTGHFLFAAPNFTHDDVSAVLRHHDDIETHERQEVVRRSRRTLDFADLADPLYESGQQWHLRNTRGGYDLNVTDAWSYGIRGNGVVVAIIDDGVEWRHDDLRANYCAEGSFDLNDDDDDPTPKRDDKSENKHGTRCAGEVAAVRNSVCGVGVAYEAKFSGIRILDGLLTDSIEATAFTRKLDVNDIYSCSWGPEDDGETVDGPRWLATAALQHGVLAGRSGFGSIFFVASGNGGQKADNCNYDGYASSIYTVTIAAVDERGRTPDYAEKCASMMTSTLSSGSSGFVRPIATTDWTYDGEQCTTSFTGTSAATPLAAGIVALMLQVRPCLSWRDVKHIIAMTSSHVTISGEVRLEAGYVTNAANFTHSDYHGFGFLDTWRAINAARVWRLVPWMTSLRPLQCSGGGDVIAVDKPLQLSCRVSEGDGAAAMLTTIEHVIVYVTVQHEYRGKLKYVITCPSGTQTVVDTRPRDKSNQGLKERDFMTVKCWGESPVGEFRLKVIDTRKPKADVNAGKLVAWRLVVYGSAMTSRELRERWVAVESAYGDYDDIGAKLMDASLDCPLGQKVTFDFSSMLSERTLKLVALLSGFFLFWAFYNLIESMFCSADLKLPGAGADQQDDDVTMDGYATMTNDHDTSSPTHHQHQQDQIRMSDLSAPT